MTLEDGASVIGGGSAPEVQLPTTLVALEDTELSAASLEERLRGHGIPIITRTERDRVMIDLAHSVSRRRRNHPRGDCRARATCAGDRGISRIVNFK